MAVDNYWPTPASDLGMAKALAMVFGGAIMVSFLLLRSLFRTLEKESATVQKQTNAVVELLPCLTRRRSVFARSR